MNEAMFVFEMQCYTTNSRGQLKHGHHEPCDEQNYNDVLLITQKYTKTFIHNKDEEGRHTLGEKNQVSLIV